MQKIQLTKATEYNSLNELPAEYKSLILEAHDAAKTAYAPYSAFHVGTNSVVSKWKNHKRLKSGKCISFRFVCRRVAVLHQVFSIPG